MFTRHAVAEPSTVVENRVDYEHRIGKRAQYEVGVPFNLQQGDAGEWNRGLGDVNPAYRYTFYDSLARGSIAAAGAEVTLPTGKETQGLGGGVTIFEGFGMCDQALPRDSFRAVPCRIRAAGEPRRSRNNSLYWRTAVGKTLSRTVGPYVDADGRSAGRKGTRYGAKPNGISCRRCR